MPKKKKNEVASISSSDLSALLYNPGAGVIERPFSRDIFLTHTLVAGCGHVEHIKEYLAELNEGDRLTLLREPKNEYDEFAILVKDPKDRKLGYIPRARNHVFARLMDAGKLLFAKVTSIGDVDNVEDFPYRILTIEIYLVD